MVLTFSTCIAIGERNWNKLHVVVVRWIGSFIHSFDHCWIVSGHNSCIFFLFWCISITWWNDRFSHFFSLICLYLAQKMNTHVGQKSRPRRYRYNVEITMQKWGFSLTFYARWGYRTVYYNPQNEITFWLWK